MVSRSADKTVHASCSDGRWNSHFVDSCLVAADGVSVISVPRSFGLSTTTGARGDAVSYVLDMCATGSAAPPSAPASAFTIRGVVKVIKSQSTFQQELAALTLIHTILPSPHHAHYPHALAASWAFIPTSIPVAVSGSTTFARPYSVSSMASTTAASTSSSALDNDTCKGGLLLMDCAPGSPVSEYFKFIGQDVLGSPSRTATLAELAAALRAAARALAELHIRSTVKSDAVAARQFIDETTRQMADMLQKLAMDAYEATRDQWQIDVPAMTRRMEEMRARALNNSGGESTAVHAHDGFSVASTAQFHARVCCSPADCSLLHHSR
jgi:hypothetical protein